MAVPASWVSPCPPEERAAALSVLYRRVPDSLRPQLIAHALSESEQGELDFSGLWIARRRGRVVGALLTQPLAGRAAAPAAAVWAPEVVTRWGRSAMAVALVRGALENLRARGFRMAQALLDESAPRHGASDLSAGGLPHVTELSYLERETSIPLAVTRDAPALDWISYSPSIADTFSAVVRATYEASLDMPELEGVRSFDDMLVGHRMLGRFVADRWRLAWVRGEPEAAAVVLLSEAFERDAWEVAYLGLTPAARGRGLGRAMLAHALDLARPHVPRLILAVDVRNRPACRLYRATGFTPFDRRAVHLVVWPQASQR
jgi:ribosomal protein S18 acetylase RimI-like enzyme